MFGLGVVHIGLVPVSKSRFTATESEVYLQILSQELLCKELIVTAFMAVGSGEGDILMLVLPVNLVAMHLHFPDEFFLGTCAVGNGKRLSDQHILPLVVQLSGGFHLGNRESILLTELVRIFFYPRQLACCLVKLFAVFYVHGVHYDVVVKPLLSRGKCIF